MKTNVPSILEVLCTSIFGDNSSLITYPPHKTPPPRLHIGSPTTNSSPFLLDTPQAVVFEKGFWKLQPSHHPTEKKVNRSILLSDLTFTHLVLSVLWLEPGNCAISMGWGWDKQRTEMEISASSNLCLQSELSQYLIRHPPLMFSKSQHPTEVSNWFTLARKHELLRFHLASAIHRTQPCHPPWFGWKAG